MAVLMHEQTTLYVTLSMNSEYDVDIIQSGSGSSQCEPSVCIFCAHDYFMGLSLVPMSLSGWEGRAKRAGPQLGTYKEKALVTGSIEQDPHKWPST